MFTVCPKCTLTLAVTANDLRVGQGYVRCGRCSNVFNALLRLSEALDDADGDGGAPIAQADPASNSQISRAISSEATSAAATPPAPRSTAAAPGAPMPAAPMPAAPSTTAARPAATSAAAGTPLRRSTDLPPGWGAGARTSAPVAPTSAQRATQAPPAPQAAATHRAALPPVGARAAAAAASVEPEASPFAAPPPGGSHTPTDDEAIDQFELVLKTLGLSLEENEPPLHQLTSAAEPSESDAPDTPKRVVENIVLEGEGVSQSQAEVPDRPLDELDQFTRRLSRVSEAERPSATRNPPAHAAGRRPAGPPPERRGFADGRPPQAVPGTSAGRAAHTAARGSGPPGGARRADVPHADVSRDPREPDGLVEISFEDGAALDDLSLSDPMLDEPLPAESIEPMEEAHADVDLGIPALGRDPYRWAWLAGCLLLALLLVLQVIGHWRERLALSPTWGGAVRAAYAAVGAPIAPHWDLTAYEVRQQGAESEPGQRAQIRVRFSLANHATHAQPVPLLRLTLLDRYGRRVAQRDLTPADYWPQGRAPAAFLAGDERIDTEVQVRDPSADSASFELDVCLRDARGLLRCAGDANTGGSAAGAGVDGAP